MNDSVLFSIAVLLAAALGATITHSALTRSWQHEAVARGHAEYIMLPEGGTKWRWKTLPNTVVPLEE